MAERARSPIQRYSPATLTDMWTVPTDIEATINVIACNQNTERATFSLAIAPAGEAAADEHYVCRDTPVDANRPFEIVVGMTLHAGAVVRVQGTGFSFQLFRIERDSA